MISKRHDTPVLTQEQREKAELRQGASIGDTGQNEMTGGFEQAEVCGNRKFLVVYSVSHYIKSAR